MPSPGDVLTAAIGLVLTRAGLPEAALQNGQRRKVAVWSF